VTEVYNNAAMDSIHGLNEVLLPKTTELYKVFCGYDVMMVVSEGVWSLELWSPGCSRAGAPCWEWGVETALNINLLKMPHVCSDTPWLADVDTPGSADVDTPGSADVDTPGSADIDTPGSYALDVGWL